MILRAGEVYASKKCRKIYVGRKNAGRTYCVTKGAPDELLILFDVPSGERRVSKYGKIHLPFDISEGLKYFTMEDIGDNMYSIRPCDYDEIVKNGYMPIACKKPTGFYRKNGIMTFYPEDTEYITSHNRQNMYIRIIAKNGHPYMEIRGFRTKPSSGTWQKAVFYNNGFHVPAKFMHKLGYRVYHQVRCGGRNGSFYFCAADMYDAITGEVISPTTDSVVWWKGAENANVENIAKAYVSSQKGEIGKRLECASRDVVKDTKQMDEVLDMSNVKLLMKGDAK